MNAGQENFFNFILERVQEGQQTAAKELLSDNFQKQANGTFTRDDMVHTQTELMQMIKPEAVEELKTAMAHFVSQQK